MGVRNVALALATTVLATGGQGCRNVCTTWTGFYYPNLDKIQDQATWRLSPPLNSVDECRQWVNAVRHKRGNDDFSCGRNCRFTPEWVSVGETVICETKTK